MSYFRIVLNKNLWRIKKQNIFYACYHYYNIEIYWLKKPTTKLLSFVDILNIS